MVSVGPTIRNSLFFPIVIAVVFLTGCTITPAEGPSNDTFYAEGTKEGYMLARQHCTTCHNFVPAGLVSRHIWDNNVLPNMAQRLGIGVFGEKMYINNPRIPSAVSYTDFMKIVDYYLKSAPEQLTIPKPAVPIIKDWSIFTLKKPVRSNYYYAKTTLTQVDTVTDNIYTADAITGYLYRWNNKLELLDSVFTGTPVVSASFFDSPEGRHNGVFTTVGDLTAHDHLLGTLLQFDLGNNLKIAADTIAAALPRPVQSVRADFNNDGLQDYVICGFGHEQGGLYWYQQLPDGKYKKNVIVETPGAVHVITGDFNKDGYTDLMVLFGQAEESIRLYTNDQKGSFTLKKLLSFPSVYGSTSFQLIDFNKDGLLDILYTCGDNADLTQEFKPYHGVYIYLNKGDFKFEQAYFYHINGCTKAVAADFDGDGDLDIATIAFFADVRNNPAEKFLYFRQDGPLHFQAYSPPVGQYGRWLCMEVRDYDHDGDPDIILGNFSAYMQINKKYVPDWDMRLPMIVLENKTVSEKK
jgi:hypothetical protein